MGIVERMRKANMGIVERMRKAKADGDVKEMAQLLETVKTFRFASGNTKRKLKRIAKEN